MRGVVMRMMMVGVAAVLLAAMGCATASDYSGYSTQQLRHQLMLEQQTVSFHVQKVEKRQYQAVYGNEDSGGQGITAQGGFLHALASRIHYERAEAIKLELLKRGEKP